MIPGASSSVRKPHILVAHGHALAWTALCEALAARWNVHAAEDGPTAVAQVKAQPPDLVVVDGALEGMKGVSLVAALREAAPTRSIPVLVVTPPGGMPPRSPGNGADDHLPAGVQAEELVARVDAHLQRAASRRAVQRTDSWKRVAFGAAGVGAWEWWPGDGAWRLDDGARTLLGCGAAGEGGEGPFLGRVHPEDIPAVQDALHRAHASGEKVEVEFRPCGVASPVRWLQASARVHHDGEGGHPSVAGALVDITQRKRIEEELRTALRAREDFLSIATHELRTPLASMLLRLQLLQRNAQRQDHLTSSEALASLEPVLRQLSRLSKMIDNLLDVTRLSNGRVQLDVEAFDLAELAQDVVLRLQPVATAAGVTLSFTGEGGTVIGYWDHSRVEQVLTNLITNAIKYGASRPVSVGVDANETHARVTVEDRGIGIAAQDHRRIFERFERTTEVQKEKSLGLGLFIVKELVEAHGGSVHVDSQLGRGSRFIVLLPRKTMRRPG